MDLLSSIILCGFEHPLPVDGCLFHVLFISLRVPKLLLNEANRQNMDQLCNGGSGSINVCWPQLFVFVI